MVAEPLSPDDARILALETGPVAGHTVKVVVAGPPALPFRALRERVAAGLGDLPSLRRRLGWTDDDPPHPTWVDDASFALDAHLRLDRAATPLPEPELPGVAARLMTGRLDRGRPLWSLHVVPLSGERTALVLRVHHAMADGAAAARILAGLLWDPTGPAPGAGDPGANGGERRARRASEVAVAVAGAAAAKSSAAIYRGVGTVASLFWRELVPRGGRTPFGRSIGLDRTVAWTTAPLAELRAGAKELVPGATLNDALLAGVASGLRVWLLARGESSGRVRVKIPVNLHPAGEARSALGNHDGFLFCLLPLHERDPAARLRAIATTTAARKRAHDAERLDALLQRAEKVPVMNRLAQVVSSPREFTLNVSNVRGPAGAVSILGSPVTALYSVAEIGERHALRISAISGAGLLSVTLCADPRRVPDAAGLAEAIGEGLAELSGAGRT